MLILALIIPFLLAKCPSNHIWNGQKCDYSTTPDKCPDQMTFALDQTCQQCPIGCSTCISLTQSQNSTIKPLISNLIIAHQIVFCLSCNQDYQLINFHCYSKGIGVNYNGWQLVENPKLHINIPVDQIVNCDTINPQTGRCQTCSSNSFLNELELCETCDPHCQKCIHRSLCDSCIDGYFWHIDPRSNTRKCQPCVYPCLQCALTDTFKCLKCQTGFYLDQSCQSCIENCDLCGDANSCIQCKQGYYNNEQICKKCLNGCKQCSNNQKCNECFPDYLISSDKCYKCNELVNNCAQCNEYSQCVKCNEAYYLKDKSCLPCNGEIEGLIDCVYEKLKFYPIQCEVNRFLVDDQCIVGKQETCKTVDSQGDCKSCYEDYILNPDTKVCEQCSIEGCSKCKYDSGLVCQECKLQYQLKDKVCQQCAPNCDECQDGQCQQCSINYYLNEVCQKCLDKQCRRCNENECIQCMDGYYLYEGWCIKCSQGCKICEDQRCNECYDKYFLNIQHGYCSRIIEGCGAYFKDKQQQCAICQYEYYQHNQECYPQTIWMLNEKTNNISVDEYIYNLLMTEEQTVEEKDDYQESDVKEEEADANIIYEERTKIKTNKIIKECVKKSYAYLLFSVIVQFIFL